MGYILFLVALLLFPIFALWGFVEILISLFYKRKFWKGLKNLGDIFKLLAIQIDKMLNVILQIPANRLLQKDGYKFGNLNDTLSTALGKNKQQSTLTKFGLTICKILHFIDANHCEKSVI